MVFISCPAIPSSTVWQERGKRRTLSHCLLCVRWWNSLVPCSQCCIPLPLLLVFGLPTLSFPQEMNSSVWRVEEWASEGIPSTVSLCVVLTLRTEHSCRPFQHPFPPVCHLPCSTLCLQEPLFHLSWIRFIERTPELRSHSDHYHLLWNQFPSWQLHPSLALLFF